MLAHYSEVSPNQLDKNVTDFFFYILYSYG